LCYAFFIKGGIFLVYKSRLTEDYYKPGEVAKLLGVNPMTIINYDKQGKLIFERTATQRRIIRKENLIQYLKNAGLYVDDEKKRKKDVVYARVSTKKQEKNGDLDQQVNLILNYVAFQQPQEVMVIKEIASGFNDNRRQFNKLLDMVMKEEVNRIFILYKDRLTRFGYHYLEKVCQHFQVEIVIVSKEENNKMIQEELAEDLCAVIHSFSGKLYGLRHLQKQKIEKELQAIRTEGGKK